MNRFLSFSIEELDTLSDALMFDRVNQHGLSDKLTDEVMEAYTSKLQNTRSEKQ